MSALVTVPTSLLAGVTLSILGWLLKVLYTKYVNSLSSPKQPRQDATKAPKERESDLHGRSVYLRAADHGS